MNWAEIIGPEVVGKVRPETRDKYLKQSFLRQYVIDNFLNQVESLVRKSGAKTILDLGCGEGLVDYFMLKRLTYLEIIGVDIDHQALAVAKHLNPKVKYQEMDCRSTDLAEVSFDLVMANEVLEHLEDYSRVIQEAYRISRRYFLVSVPEWPFYQATNFMIGKNLTRWGEHPDHVVSFTKAKLKSDLEICFKGRQTWKRAYPWLIVLAEKL